MNSLLCQHLLMRRHLLYRFCCRFMAALLHMSSLVLPLCPVIYHSLYHVLVWSIPLFFYADRVSASPFHLTKQDWSATAHPGGLNLFAHTRPPCLFWTAFFASNLCFLFLPLFCVFLPSPHHFIFSSNHPRNRSISSLAYMLCFTLPSKHSCRMTHYLCGKKRSLIQIWWPGTCCD